MRDLDKHIAISRSMGYHVIADETAPDTYRLQLNQSDVKSPWVDSVELAWMFAPNWLTDRGEMAVAIRELPEELQPKFAWILSQLLDDNFSTWEPSEFASCRVWEMSLDNIHECMTCPLKDWVRAYLITTGLWQGDYRNE